MFQVCCGASRVPAEGGSEVTQAAGAAPATSSSVSLLPNAGVDAQTLRLAATPMSEELLWAAVHFYHRLLPQSVIKQTNQ